ncbi:hypothetical protein GGR50DRAFT_677869 [Xylaria sp. CBS 124048]|nr:hypothetical protein GGR50DRAFT_677869 [Xylaria sp. CBS 124048]
MMSTLSTAAIFIAAAQALAFDGRPARATDAVVPDPTFHLSEVTPAPDIKELMKRQAIEQTVLFAPDNTCGYVSGRAGDAFTCNGGNTCAFIIEPSYGAVGCCNGDSCGLRAACMDYKQVFISSACDNGCLQDTFTAKCTDTALPYCGTVTFFSGIQDFYCASLSISTPQQLYTTYLGQTGRTFQQVLLTTSASGSGDESFILSGTDSPSSSGGGGGSGSGSSNGNNNHHPQSKASSTPIGPIVGGVVGGVGGLALIGLALFFIIRHSNNKKKSNASVQQQQQVAAGMAPNGDAPGYQPQQIFDPNNQQQQQHPYPQQQPTPPGGQVIYYPTEQKPVGFVGVTPAAPDRNDSTSPVSQVSDARHSAQPHSPMSTLTASWAQQPGTGQNNPPTVHEAGGNVVGQRDYNSNHRGQFHEMG